MAKFRVTYQIEGTDELEQQHFEVAGQVSSCDDVLRALGSHLKPQEFWPFVVADKPMTGDADLAERAVRMHRIRAACKYLQLASITYLLEGQSLEVYCGPHLDPLPNKETESIS